MRAPTAATEVRRYKRPSAATAAFARGRFAARADVGIGPYRRQQRCSGTNGFPQPPYPPREAASRRGPMNASAPTARLRQTYQPTMCSGRIRVKTAVCDVSPCSEAAGAALVKTSVAVTAIRFYWPARSREGAGSMGRDSPVARNGPGNASSGDARRAAPRGTGGPQPPARFRHFSAVKSAPPEANKPNCRSAPAECTRQSLPCVRGGGRPVACRRGCDVIQTAFRSHHTLRERPLRGSDAQCAPLRAPRVAQRNLSRIVDR